MARFAIVRLFFFMVLAFIQLFLWILFFTYYSVKECALLSNKKLQGLNEKFKIKRSET
jgi:hypothetical protein